MQYRVVIKQDDVSVKTWTLTEMIQYLKRLFRYWATFTLEFNGTTITIERVK